MPILLREEGLLERTLIYATDINLRALEQAEAGVYAIERVAGFTANHRQSGATTSLSDYYTAAYGRAVFDKSLRAQIVFSDHSLATDSVFAEMQLVSCRNVLIYFTRELQERAIGLFREVLSHKGFLGIGSKESLRFSAHADAFDDFATPRTHLSQAVGRMTIPPSLESLDAVVVGASAGGVDALLALMPALAAGTHAAIIIVLHLPRQRPSALAAIFGKKCALPVREAEDKEPVARGTVYVAPPDYHLLIDRTAGRGSNGAPLLALSADDPVNYSRPSIDVLFESAADIYGDRVAGVLLTGANSDGAIGLAAVRRAGGVTIVQDPATAVASGHADRRAGARSGGLRAVGRRHRAPARQPAEGVRRRVTGAEADRRTSMREARRPHGSVNTMRRASRSSRNRRSTSLVRIGPPTCADMRRHAPTCADMRRHAATCADLRRFTPGRARRGARRARPAASGHDRRACGATHRPRNACGRHRAAAIRARPGRRRPRRSRARTA